MSIKAKLITCIFSMLIIAGIVAFVSLYFFYNIYNSMQKNAAISHALSNLFVVFCVAIALIIISMIITIGVISSILIRSVLRPLKTLSKMTKEIQQGNLERSLLVYPSDEFGALLNEFDNMRDRLKATLKASADSQADLRVMMANIAHDIKTPVTVICGNAEGILDGIAKTPEKQKQYLETIYQKGLLVDKLVNDLYVYSKLGINKDKLNMERTDINGLIKDFYDGNSNGIEISYEFTDDIYVMADKYSLIRVMQNVTENSIKHSNLKEEELKIAISTRINADKIIIKVTDNGSGISDELCDKIFDRFFREDSSRTQTELDKSGSGLGLSICKQIIERMDGKIWARSPQNEGMSIYISLMKCT